MAAAAATFALVIMMNGWVQGGASGARGNAIHHIPGFTTMNKCDKAAERIRTASVHNGVQSEFIKTVCLDTMSEPVTGNTLVIITNGWDTFGSGAQGNAIDHIPGFSTTQNCEAAGNKVVAASANKDNIKTTCVDP